MEHRDAFVVGYLGGSITEGAGASCDETTYRRRVTAWLQAAHPQWEVREINAGVGGTGSALGVCRMDHDLLWAKPDLVFVEFAVNDDGVEESLCLRSVEGIVRKLLRNNPQMHIVFLYTITESYMDRFYSRGELPDAVKFHQRVADFYGIPSVNVGLALYQYLQQSGEDVTAYLPDRVHPNDQGYALYAETIVQFLDTAKFSIAMPEKPMVPGAYEKAALIPARQLVQAPWTVVEQTMMGRYEDFIACDTAGAELTVPFAGTMIGLYWTIEQDSGMIEYSIDGGPIQRQSAWDHYALSFNRACSVLLATDLEAGAHQLRIRIAKEKDAQSNGRWIRIGAFLTDGGEMDLNALLRQKAEKFVAGLSQHPVLGRHWNALSVILKGSTARGYSDVYSDVDFVVFTDEAGKQEIVQEYQRQGLSQREDGVFLPLGDWEGHYNIDTYEALAAHFEEKELPMIWEYTNVVILHDGHQRYQSLLDRYAGAVWEQEDRLIQDKYLEIQLNLDWMRQPLRRGDVGASLLYVAKVFRGVQQLVFLLQRKLYPCDKWLGFYFKTLPGMEDLREAIRQYTNVVATLPDCQPGLALMDYPAYERAYAIVQQIQQLLRERYGEARWIEEWYLYA